MFFRNRLDGKPKVRRRACSELLGRYQNGYPVCNYLAMFLTYNIIRKYLSSYKRWNKYFNSVLKGFVTFAFGFPSRQFLLGKGLNKRSVAMSATILWNKVKDRGRSEEESAIMSSLALLYVLGSFFFLAGASPCGTVTFLYSCEINRASV